MHSMICRVDDHGVRYRALLFVCPGCFTFHEFDTGLHMLPVNTSRKTPAWHWNGDLEFPTITPSILTCKDHPDRVCHSFLTNGVFDFLTDSAHMFAGLKMPMVDLPHWVVHD